MPTSWTEATVEDTAWENVTYPAGTSFVLVMGVVVPVDADGNGVTPEGAVSWTEGTVPSTSLTETTVPSTTFTETSL